MIFSLCILNLPDAQTCSKQQTDVNVVVIDGLHFPFVVHIAQQGVVHKDINFEFCFPQVLCARVCACIRVIDQLNKNWNMQLTIKHCIPIHLFIFF